MRNCFREFDVNGDGTISRAELGDALAKSSLSEQEVGRILEMADADGSGTISYEEFIEKVFNWRWIFIIDRLMAIMNNVLVCY